MPILALNFKHGERNGVVQLPEARFRSYTKEKIEKCVQATTSTALSLAMQVEDRAYEPGQKITISANREWARFLPMMKAKVHRHREDRDPLENYVFFDETNNQKEELEGSIVRKHEDGKWTVG